MNDTDIKIRLEKLENIGARVAVMLQRDVERLEERVRELELDNE
jgi:3-deoxy-D-manno-octulosonate 8-phosphate phosphatase KdsC-like HAD superfamily phosphatase